MSNTLAELPPALPTVLVGFTDSADVVYEGRAGDRATFERTMRTATATAPGADAGTGAGAGGAAAGSGSGEATVASALERAWRHLAGLEQQPAFARLLLVTDALTAPGDLLQAAYDCAHAGITVDVVVLDGSPRAAELAEVIVKVTGGTWEAAPGEEDLGRAISAAGRRVAHQSLQREAGPAGTVPGQALPSPTARASRPDAQAAVVQPDPVPQPDLQPEPLPEPQPKSGPRPDLEPEPQPEPDPQSEPEPQSRPESGPAPAAGEFVVRQPAAVAATGWYPVLVTVPPAADGIASGTWIEIVPSASGLRFRPARRVVEWEGTAQTASFEVAATAGGDARRRRLGQVEVSVGGLPIAQLPLDLAVENSQVADTAAAGEPAVSSGLPQVVIRSGAMFREVYGSYASSDAEIVRRFRENYQSLGITLFLDGFDTPGPREWKPELEAAIERADLFGLFWSEASAVSGYVETEWRRALEVAGSRGSLDAFVCPMSWTPSVPAPPPPLAELRLRRMDPWSSALVARQGLRRESGEAVTGEGEAGEFGVAAGVELAEFGAAAGSEPEEFGMAAGPELGDLGVAAGSEPAQPGRPVGASEQNEVPIAAESAGSGPAAGHGPAAGLGPAAGFGPTAGSGPAAGPPPVGPRRVDVTFPVFTLVPTLANGNVERIGESLRTIVPFLEDLTGLRYYPPPTYVTDDTTATRLRRTCEPDARFLAEEQAGEVAPGVLDAGEEELVERVRELLLTFGAHVVDVGPDTDLVHVRREAMGGFVRNVRRALAGRPTRLDEDSAVPPGFPEPPMIWRQRCAEDFPSFAGLYCELVIRYVDRHVRARSRNRIDPQVRARLVAELGPRAAAAIERSVGGVVAEPPVDLEFRAGLAAALDELRALVGAREQVVSDYLGSGANTFGVFRFSGGAGRFGRSGMLVPTSAPAVLIGAGALTKVAAALRGDAVLDEPIWERAAEFCELALLHDHAHAAIATGLDEHGARAAAVGTSAWSAGTGLNEALATWAQLHFYRDDPRMARECVHYIRSGPARSWPYRGADVLEERYQAEGIEAVRGLVRRLRSSPEEAQAEFDLLAARRPT
ncbi:toll/interleukin-1 receptor domain-containing protein [Frankia sp. R43]|uniref:toll/interleukin-1 receptor domain-containing protein n=1 Tax=Frankia sp. R43 TaxID=269536 RepID=UPI00128F3F76|nr:toll/interleukin-1 receptor domain-containing protein [Frankia sp. R43]